MNKYCTAAREYLVDILLCISQLNFREAALELGKESQLNNVRCIVSTRKVGCSFF